MLDQFKRDVHYLRLSVTDKCNLRCIYCMPESGVARLRHEDILSVEEIADVVQACSACGINKVRITGGEPLVRRGIIEICKRVAGTKGISEVCLTTNGILMPKFADELKTAGVNRINISLDSLRHATYNEITRDNALDEALIGLRVALETDFDAIKVNAVLIGGVNDDDILDLLDLTRKYKLDVRFIELMPIGECADWASSRFVSAQNILKLAPDLKEAGTDGVSKQYMLPDGLGTVGLIRPISSHFCPTCNRIRITAEGKLKPCLHSVDEINLRGLHGADLERVIRDAIYGKPKKHKFMESSPPRNMNEIGG
ncbi:MAG: GTP 3',8-cyclase MoaA [Oscillospiraceae bacterium]|nr:GTP 3',8-cyclase MoaA [Oscillospiraceae bacterium]